MNRIYCGECKHYKYPKLMPECVHPDNVQIFHDNVGPYYLAKREARIINFNNDCNWFENKPEKTLNDHSKTS